MWAKRSEICGHDYAGVTSFVWSSVLVKSSGRERPGRHRAPLVGSASGRSPKHRKRLESETEILKGTQSCNREKHCLGLPSQLKDYLPTEAFVDYAKWVSPALKNFLNKFYLFYFQNLFGWTWSWLPHVGPSSLTRDPTRPSVLGTQCLSHQTTGDVLCTLYCGVLCFLYSHTLTSSLSHLPFPLLGMLFSQTSIGLVTSLLSFFFFFFFSKITFRRHFLLI